MKCPYCGGKFEKIKTLPNGEMIVVCATCEKQDPIEGGIPQKPAAQKENNTSLYEDWKEKKEPSYKF